VDPSGDLGPNNVMAINAVKGRVGMCMYSRSEQKLLFIEDQQDSEDWDLVRLGKFGPIPGRSV